MSQENVELHRETYDAWNRGDRETWRASGDPNIELILPVISQVEGGDTWRGHEGADRLWDTWQETFPGDYFHVEEIRDLGDRTLASLRLRARGARSDVPFDQQIWHVVEWRNNKAVRLESFLNEGEALVAAGLSD